MQSGNEIHEAANGGAAMLLRPNRRLTSLAAQVARCAQPLMPNGSGMFMTLELRPDGELHLLWWRARDLVQIARIAATPEAFCSEDSDEGAMQEAALALIEYLAGRWPATPLGLGVITDGTGIAFAPDHPLPSAPGWFVRHAAGEATLAMILALDPEGPCALLAGRPEHRTLH